MTKKKILLCIDWFLPGTKAGGPVRSCANLINHLSGEFDFSIITRNTDYRETTPYASVKSDVWIEQKNYRIFYFSKEKLSVAAIRRILHEAHYDAVYLNGIFSFWFTLVPLFLVKRAPSVKVVIAARGMFASGALSIKPLKKNMFLQIAKVTGLFSNVLFHATNESEEKDIHMHLGKNVRIHVAPNLPGNTEVPAPGLREKLPGILKLVSVARIAPEKNLHYAIQVLCEVGKKIDAGCIEFDIYGSVYNEKYWEECRQRMLALPPGIRATYHGFLEPEKGHEVLSHCHFLFMPTLGENFGHIILESLVAGCPVIISDQTPWRNMQQHRAGWDLPLHAPQEFEKTILHCFHMSQDAYRELSISSHEYARRIINNPDVQDANKSLFL